ncbi:MAG TPA: hypothetical protein VGE45_00320 [Chloroflexia bacterium]
MRGKLRVWVPVWLRVARLRAEYVLRNLVKQPVDLFRGPMRIAECLAGLLAVGWGLNILDRAPSDTAGSMVMTTMFALMGSRAVWGNVITVIGLVQVIGALWSIRWMRVSTSLIAAPFWGGVAVLIGFLGAQKVAALPYAAFTAVCSIAYWKLIGAELPVAVSRVQRIASRRRTR